MGSRRLCTSILRVLNQVVHHLAQLSCIPQDGWQSRLQLPTHWHHRIHVIVQGHHLPQHLIHIQRLQTRLWQAAKVTEFIHQSLQSIYLVNDGFHGFGDQGLISDIQLALQLHGQAFGRKLDGCERIFDFMGQASGHLGPSLGALCRDNFGDVIKDQQPIALWQQGTSSHQGGVAHRLRSKVVGSVTRQGRVQFKGLLPVVQTVLLMLTRKLGKLLHHLVTEHLQAFHRLQGFAHMRGHGDLQNARRSGVDGQDLAISIQQNHTGGQVVQHGLQMAACQIHLRHAALD